MICRKEEQQFPHILQIASDLAQIVRIRQPPSVWQRSYRREPHLQDTGVLTGTGESHGDGVGTMEIMRRRGPVEANGVALAGALRVRDVGAGGSATVAAPDGRSGAQNASAATAMTVSAPDVIRARRVAVPGIRRSMKNRPVSRRVSRRASPGSSDIFSAALAMRAHI